MIISTVILSISLGIRQMTLLRGSAWGADVRLTAGLAASAAIALVHALLFYCAVLVGYVLRFDPEQYGSANVMIAVGLVAIVSVRWLLQLRRKSTLQPAYSIATVPAVGMLALASGVNVFLIGLGIGFVCSEPNSWSMLPLFLLSLAGAYFGVMFGRRKVAMRTRRWQFMSVILLIGSVLPLLLI